MVLWVPAGSCWHLQMTSLEQWMPLIYEMYINDRDRVCDTLNCHSESVLSLRSRNVVIDLLSNMFISHDYHCIRFHSTKGERVHKKAHSGLHSVKSKIAWQSQNQWSYLKHCHIITALKNFIIFTSFSWHIKSLNVRNVNEPSIEPQWPTRWPMT